MVHSLAWLVDGIRGGSCGLYRASVKWHMVVSSLEFGSNQRACYCKFDENTIQKISNIFQTYFESSYIYIYAGLGCIRVFNC